MKSEKYRAIASLKEGLDLKQHYAKLEGGVEGKESLDFFGFRGKC